jgi:hypothetical protein
VWEGWRFVAQQPQVFTLKPSMFCGVTKLRTNPLPNPFSYHYCIVTPCKKWKLSSLEIVRIYYYANSSVCWQLFSKAVYNLYNCVMFRLRCLWILNKHWHHLDWVRRVEMVYFAATAATKQLRSFQQHLTHLTTSRLSVKQTDTHELVLCHNHTFRIRQKWNGVL